MLFLCQTFSLQVSVNKAHDNQENTPALLLQQMAGLIYREAPSGPILDLACGEGKNGLFLAKKGLPVILADNSAQALAHATALAKEYGLAPRIWQVDLEKEGVNPLETDAYGAILVFRYLHRSLIPCIRKGLKERGILVYETFTVDQTHYGKPHNPNFLLKPGELRAWFADWEIIYYYEGIRLAPVRAVAQLVCRKPEETRV